MYRYFFLVTFGFSSCLCIMMRASVQCTIIREEQVFGRWVGLKGCFLICYYCFLLSNVYPRDFLGLLPLKLTKSTLTLYL